MKFDITSLLFLLIPFLFFSQNFLAQSKTTAIKDVTVIDVTDGSLSPMQTVLFRGNRIIKIGGSVEIPKKAQLIEAKGKFLIPGLWDMHAHDIVNYRNLFVANGITGLRDLAGSFEIVRKMDSLKNKKIITPRYLVGHLVEGEAKLENPCPAPCSLVDTTEEAINVVDSLAQNGAAFIKTYMLLKPEVFEAIMSRAREKNIPVAGHVPDQVSIKKASDLGIKSIEHSAFLLKNCTPLADNLIKEYGEIREISSYEELLSAYLKIYEKENNSFDKNLCRKLAKTLASNGTAVTPTLTATYKFWNRKKKKFYNNPNLRYMPVGFKSWWKAENSTLTDHEWKVAQEIHPLNMELVQILNEQDVLLLAGTDSPFNIPGFTLHEELELLVQAGLTPLEALQTATLNPAKFMNREKDLGTVEAGKLADLLLLKANPLENISNTTKIEAVILDGKYLNQESIKLLLEKMALNAKAK